MPAPTPYISFPGNAREALTHYAEVFGGRAEFHTLEAFNRTDGPADAIAHGMVHGPVELAGSDAVGDDASLNIEGVLFSLLGTAEPAVLRGWFERLSDDGVVVDPFGPKPWGDSDGQVRDRFGITWLIGHQGH